MCRSEKSHRGHRKIKCEISQALVMINLYVKFNVHSSYAKQVIVLKVVDRRTDASGDDNRHPPKFWLRPKKPIGLHGLYKNIPALQGLILSPYDAVHGE